MTKFRGSFAAAVGAALLVFLAGAGAGRADDSKDEAKKEVAALAGSWKGQSLVQNGKPAPKEAVEKLRLEIADDKFNGMPFTIDPSAKPKALDLTYEKDGKKLVAKCIYELSGDTLRICRPFKDPSQRPTKFESVDGVNLMVWERSKK
jgi:uncharacterized protein (TIGR03067 family)